MPALRKTGRWFFPAAAVVVLLAACTDDPSDQASPTVGPAAATTSILETRPTLADEGIPNWVGDVVNLHDVENGSCFNQYSWVQEERLVEIDTRVPCIGPHQFEVYLRTEHPARAGAPWPGDREMEAFARAKCYGAFADFVGEIYELSELELGYITPTRADFEHEEARFRGIHCYVQRGDGEEMIGSARDSRR
jgi:hypothetical protein